MLLLYAISPILVYGGELRRPDHQSLAMLLVAITNCAEWTLQVKPSPNWSAVSNVAWESRSGFLFTNRSCCSRQHLSACGRRVRKYFRALPSHRLDFVRGDCHTCSGN